MVDGDQIVGHGEVRQKPAPSDELAVDHVLGGGVRRPVAHLEAVVVDKQQRRHVVDARQDRSLHRGRRVRLRCRQRGRDLVSSWSKDHHCAQR